MRVYTPSFQQYGVTAVLCGHNETLERSRVGDVLVYDNGAAGDGIDPPEDEKDPRCKNPWQQWIASNDEPELWKGRQLLEGGRHYGHLEINLYRAGSGWDVILTPVHNFPVTDEAGMVTRIERREYHDEVRVHVNPDGTRIWK